MAEPAVVVIGASAGGLQALTAIVERLPASLSACVLVVVHSSPNGQGVLPQILERVSALPVAFAAKGDPVEAGRIYIARPDLHLIVDDSRVTLVHGPRENGFRPAIDPLFRTAARHFGPRVIGVILSGALSDGTYGLSMIKHYGGLAIVQDPEDAIIPSMPQSAIRSVAIDDVLPASEIGDAIVRATLGIAERQGGPEMPRAKGLEPQLPAQETQLRDMSELFGPPSGLTCPDCGGALWQVEEQRLVRYQCHVGHQYAPDNLDAAQRDIVDGALWSAVRVLEEHAELKMRMAERAAAGGLRVVSEGFAEGARDAHEQARQIRAVLFAPANGNGNRGETAAARTGAAGGSGKRSRTVSRSRRKAR